MNLYSLLYHDVISGQNLDSSGFRGKTSSLYKLSVSSFRIQMKRLAEVADQPPYLVTQLGQDSKSIPRFALTFDDSGKSSLEIADILEEHAWHGHFFVPTDYIGKRGFLNKGELAELSKRGHVVGSHSCSHPLRMSSLPPDKLFHEWKASKETLSDIINSTVDAASIPGGTYSDEIVRAASRAGIKYLFTSEPNHNPQKLHDTIVFGRYLIKRNTPNSSCASLTKGNKLLVFKSKSHWFAKSLIKSILGKYYIPVRKTIVALFN